MSDALAQSILDCLRIDDDTHYDDHCTLRRSNTG